MSKVQDEESLGDGLDPRTNQRQGLASDVSAKIADRESGAKLMQSAIWLDSRRHGAALSVGLIGRKTMMARRIDRSQRREGGGVT
jgi:hypothetical protein